VRVSAETAPQRSRDSKALSVEVLADLASELLRHVEQSDFLAVLGKFFEHTLSFDNFIVYRYQDRCAAELLYTNLNFSTLKSSMAPYISGLYLLDPFYIAATSGRRRGVLRMDEIAPEAFTESEYYGMFYKNVNVVDEVRFVIEMNGEELVHVFLEREAPHPRYSSEELQTLRMLENFVTSFVERHWEWRNMSASVSTDTRAPLAFGLRNVIGNLKRRALTAREIDIVELTVKGHSGKSIAHELGISEGTVLNHKRNIYAKLEISSQSQLFHLFLQALYGSPLAEGLPAAEGRSAQ
jgi:DNA-binding CsgD family transcriptional regulator